MLQPITLPTDPSDGAPPVAAFVVTPSRRRLPSAHDSRLVATVIATVAERCLVCGCVADSASAPCQNCGASAHGSGEVWS